MGASPLKCSPDPPVCLTVPENETALAVSEGCRFSAHLLREAAPPVVNKGQLRSSLEASVNINQRELSELSGVNESIRG